VARVPKTRAGNKWTEAQYKNFIRSALRKAWTRWGPNYTTKNEARIERGVYRCTGYQRRSHKVPASIKVNNKSVNNIFTDHIAPVVDPAEGFTTWDDFIERLLCEQDNLQVLCRTCHDHKTKDEAAIRKSTRK
jgi:5-methylcytosine-specific restriction endonuclease McrA